MGTPTYLGGLHWGAVRITFTPALCHQAVLPRMEYKTPEPLLREWAAERRRLMGIAYGEEASRFASAAGRPAELFTTPSDSAIWFEGEPASKFYRGITFAVQIGFLRLDYEYKQVMQLAYVWEVVAMEDRLSVADLSEGDFHEYLRVGLQYLAYYQKVPFSRKLILLAAVK